jgi:hypothetical protein
MQLSLFMAVFVHIFPTPYLPAINWQNDADGTSCITIGTCVT